MADTAQQIAFLKGRRNQLDCDLSAYLIRADQTRGQISNIDVRIAKLEAEATHAG